MVRITEDMRSANTIALLIMLLFYSFDAQKKYFSANCIIRGGKDARI